MEDLIWQELANYEITLTMDKLLNLVPRFRQTIETRMWGMDRVEILTNFTKSSTGPTMIDHHNPAIMVVLQGLEVTSYIIDEGSGNVINKATCNRLSITEWEVCPF